VNRHLSAEEIASWLIGERSPQLERHMSECPACFAEAARMEAALAEFRGAVRDWSEGRVCSAWRPQTRSKTARWLLAAAAGLLVICGSYWEFRARQRAAEAALADALLLEQVDAQISRAVPEPMEPLVQLVSWNTNAVNAQKSGEMQ